MANEKQLRMQLAKAEAQLVAIESRVSVEPINARFLTVCGRLLLLWYLLIGDLQQASGVVERENFQLTTENRVMKDKLKDKDKEMKSLKDEVSYTLPYLV